MTMNINEMESLAKANSGLISWQCNVPADEISELIAAYRGAIAALEVVQEMCDPPTWVSDGVIDPMLATAKRLGAIP